MKSKKIIITMMSVITVLLITIKKKIIIKITTLNVKNNFARVAFESMEIDNVSDYLKGPTAIVMAKEDSNEALTKYYFDAIDNAKTIDQLNNIKTSTVEEMWLNDLAELKANKHFSSLKFLLTSDNCSLNSFSFFSISDFIVLILLCVSFTISDKF